MTYYKTQHSYRLWRKVFNIFCCICYWKSVVSYSTLRRNTKHNKRVSDHLHSIYAGPQSLKHFYFRCPGLRGYSHAFDLFYLCRNNNVFKSKLALYHNTWTNTWIIKGFISIHMISYAIKPDLIKLMLI